MAINLTISRTQYEEAKNAISVILSAYNGSRNCLKTLYLQKRRLGTLAGTQICRDYNKLVRKERILKKYEESLLQNVCRYPHCNNCNRFVTSVELEDPNGSTRNPYHLILRSVSSDAISSGHRTYKFCGKQSNPVIMYSLCGQCHEHLCSTDRKVFKSFKNTWPSFMWSVLSSRQIHVVYGASIWRFVPIEWRCWWVDVLKARFPHVYESITIDTPPSCLHDRTRSIDQFTSNIDPVRHRQRGLQKLRDACNRYLLPTVACPFGCTEFLHRCNHLCLDLVLQRYLQKVRLLLPSDSKQNLRKCLGFRDDYFRNSGDNDCLLLNPAWAVLPSVAFDNDMTPNILCCRFHSSSTAGFMVHVSRHPGHNLPSSMPDQLAHACVKSRTVSQLRRSYGSNSYQMFRQDGSFNGIDTCSSTSFGNFDFCSYLSAENEALCLNNRPDCNALLSTLAKKGIISDHVATARRDACKLFPNRNDIALGGTYVPLRASLQFLKEQASEQTVRLCNDTRSDERNMVFELKIRRPWPLIIFPCQSLTDHGMSPPMIPQFGPLTNPTYDSGFQVERLWFLCALCSQVESLWVVLASNSIYRTSNWSGWFVFFASRILFSKMTGSPRIRNPFVTHVTSSYDKLLEKLRSLVPTSSSAVLLLSELPGIRTVTFTSELYADIQDAFDYADIENNCSVFIVENYMHNELDDIPHVVRTSQNKLFHLRCFCRSFIDRSSYGVEKLMFESFMRHRNEGDEYHSKWWNQRRGEIPLQCDEIFFDNTSFYVMCYVHEEDHEIGSAGMEMMNYIGGQSHYRCSIHKLPVIISSSRAKECTNQNCSRKEHYICPEQSCDCRICKHCVETAPDNTVSYSDDFDSSNMSNDNDSVSQFNHSSMNVSANTNGNDSDVSIEYNIDDYLSDDENDDNEFMEILNDFVTVDHTADVFEDGSRLSVGNHPDIPTTDSGDLPFQVTEDSEYSGHLGKITISGHVLMNQCGSLLTRNNHQIKGSSRHHNLLQQICATNIGTSVPLIQPEAMLFPSIFPKMVPSENILLGAIPTPFLSESITKYGFQNLPSHVRTRLTSSMSKTSTDPRYISFCYDMLTNLSATHLDTRIAMNRGLTATDDKHGGLGVRGGNESSASEFLGTIDSSKCVKNLCAAQQYHPQDFFVTITCNQLRHFGTKVVKEWIDCKESLEHFPNYHDLSSSERVEVSLAISQAAAGILLRNWQEVCALLIAFLRHSPCSPFKQVNSIFSRNEYQKEVGNLSHIHLILQVAFDKLSNEEKKFVDELIRGDIMSIVKSHEVDDLIADGLLDSFHDVSEVYQDANTFLAHRCTERCLEMVGPNEFRCRKPDYGKMTPDNTSSSYIRLPNDLPMECVDRLERIGLASRRNGGDNFSSPEFHHEFFKPSRHIPPIDNNSDCNMSPVETKLFVLCRSMQNIQMIRGCGGCNKYICKYIAKIDEQNYVVVSVHHNANGRLVTKSSFLHNTKIARSAINEDKIRKASREYSRPQGRAISLMEMIHVILKYPEVITDLRFVDIPTVPLELRSRVGLSLQSSNQDEANTVPEVVQTRREIISNQSFRQHTAMEIMIINDLSLSQMRIDRITLFSLRPPELREIFNSPGIYYRWCTVLIDGKQLSGSELHASISCNLYETSFVDGLGRLVKIRRVAFEEINEHINDIDISEADDPGAMRAMVRYFRQLIHVYGTSSDDFSVSNIENNSSDLIAHYHTHVVDHMYSGHLPVPVYSYTRPTSPHKFVLHILLSMGRFNTEVELTMHSSIRECFRHAKLIGPRDDDDSLHRYSDALLYRFIVEQLCYFSNSRRILAEWISLVGDLLDSAIVRDELLVTDMPAVQMSALLQSHDLEDIDFRRNRRCRIVSAAMKELGVDSVRRLPTMDQILSGTKENPFVWDPVLSFERAPCQNLNSFEEQKVAIKVTCSAIDKYREISAASFQTKNVGIRGFPGGGKTWCCLYCIVYAISCGLDCLTTAMMARRATSLGGTHWHRFFGLPIDSKLTPQRIAELALTKIEQNPVLLHGIQSLDVIFADELGQLSSEFVAAINIILCRIRHTGQMFGGILLIGSLDHTQIQPWEGKPFLSSPLLIPMFVMVKLSHSVRTNNQASYEMQDIARKSYSELKNSIGTANDLVERFLNLASENFTFVSKWDDPAITSSTFRVYSKRVPVADAARLFVDQVQAEFVNRRHELILIKAKDMFRMNGSRQDFRDGGPDVSAAINLKTKLPPQLCFFKGVIFECTFNCSNGTFMNSDPVLLYELPSIDDMCRWKDVRVLRFPPGWKDFDIDASLPKDYFTSQGFVEIKVPVAPSYTLSLSNSMQGKRKQYGLRHRITGTIHGAMGDTYESMASEISHSDPNYGLWDRGQLVVIISRTRLPSKTIFVGNKEQTLDTLRSVLLRRTQWTDHISDILDIITVNGNPSSPRVLTHENFPFRIRDATLPNDNSGIVYMLISLRRRTFTYIGKTKHPRRRLQNHNSGYGASATEPCHLRPFAVMAYIAGFDGNDELMLAAENKWKFVRDELIRSGDLCAKSWARAGQRVIHNSNLHANYQANEYSLRLVLLFSS